MDTKSLLESLLQEENELQFQQFTNEMALQIGLWIIEKCKESNKSATIDICRNGQQLFHYAFPGTSADNDVWVKRKARIADRFGHSSYYIETELKLIGRTLQERYCVDPSEYAPYNGSFPIFIRGVGPVGSISVSGLPGDEDHQIVTAAIRHFL